MKTRLTGWQFLCWCVHRPYGHVHRPLILVWLFAAQVVFAFVWACVFGMWFGLKKSQNQYESRRQRLEGAIKPALSRREMDAIKKQRELRRKARPGRGEQTRKTEKENQQRDNQLLYGLLTAFEKDSGSGSGASERRSARPGWNATRPSV